MFADYWLQLQILGQVALAMALGAVIGFERELADKPAGMRTHMLVAGAAALFVALADILVARGTQNGLGDLVRSDPVRVIEAIVTGVAFLGAGTIIRHRSEAAVHGLTTAAALLFTAGLGVCVATNKFLLAAGLTFLGLLTLRVIRAVESLLDRSDSTGT